MTDRQNFERLRKGIKNLLTEYKESRNNVDSEDVNDLYKVLADIGWYLYKDIEALVNESEDWEADDGQK